MTPTPAKRQPGLPSRECHIVVLGAGGVGKSCLTAQFVHSQWIESYDPTIEDTYRKQVTVDHLLTKRLKKRPVMLEILDTAGSEQFVAMRDLYMKNGQGFLLIFSITSQSTLVELASLRDEIIRVKEREDVPIVIVGNKADLEDQRDVSRSKAFSLAQRWNAPYYETSARTRTNVDAVYYDLCRQVLRSDEDSLELVGDDATPRSRLVRRRRRDGHSCVIL